jgi:pseudaminic acid biosynthesis-associated methylase
VEQKAAEARRLEELWSGSFGDDYVDRNAGAYAARGEFWAARMAQLDPQRVLEVGCNVGGNLRWIAEHVPAGGVYGVDVNRKALSRLRVEQPELNAVLSVGRDMPFRDGWFDLVFTMGVLIHQPATTLPLVMSEMVRCTRRWVLCGEYFADQPEEVAYRGHEGALFRRDYGRLFLELFPELELRDQGFLGKDQGWDDVTWWLFEKPTA